MITSDLITKDECLTSNEIDTRRIGYYIYFLIDPFNYQIKYIGKGSNNRLFDHYNNCEYEEGKKASWLRKLKKRGKEPLYVIWESYGFDLEQENQAYRDEKTFIDGFGRKGIDKQGTLLNKSNKLGVPLIVKTTEQFIEEAVSIHGDRYDYSLVDYRSAQRYVDIICPIHGVFQQYPDNHIVGQGCPKCGYIVAGKKTRSNTKEFIIKADKVHKGKYDYSKVNYVRAIDKVDIICKEHGIFKQSPNKHLDGNGCPKCGSIRGSTRAKQDTVIKQFKAVHGSKYKYDKVIYVYALEKVLIGCRECNQYFEQTPAKHKQGQGCPHCKGKKISESLVQYFKDEKDRK